MSDDNLTFGSIKLAPNSYWAVGIFMVSVDWEGMVVGPMYTLIVIDSWNSHQNQPGKPKEVKKK